MNDIYPELLIQWEAAVKSFSLALAINPLYPDCWFSLGCAAMKASLFPLLRPISLCNLNTDRRLGNSFACLWKSCTAGL